MMASVGDVGRPPFQTQFVGVCDCIDPTQHIFTDLQRKMQCTRCSAEQTHFAHVYIQNIMCRCMLFGTAPNRT